MGSEPEAALPNWEAAAQSLVLLSSALESFVFLFGKSRVLSDRINFVPVV